MAHPKNYAEYDKHIQDHADKVRGKIIGFLAGVPDCGDPECKYPVYYKGVSDEALNDTVEILLRLSHNFGNDMHFSEMLAHLMAELLRRDDQTLEWNCLSEGKR